MIASGTRIPRDSFLISVTWTFNVWVKGVIGLYKLMTSLMTSASRKQLHGVHVYIKPWICLDTKSTWKHFFVPDLHVSVVEPIPTSSEGVPRFGHPCPEGHVSDFHGSCFWLNHIWPTSKIHNLRTNQCKYHALSCLRYRLPRNQPSWLV